MWQWSLLQLVRPDPVRGRRPRPARGAAQHRRGPRDEVAVPDDRRSRYRPVRRRAVPLAGVDGSAGRRVALLAVAIGALALPAGAQAWTARPATYGVTHDSDVWIHMSDGAKLSADIYRPATPDGKPAPGRFPVLLTGTPYNKHAPGLNFESD